MIYKADPVCARIHDCVLLLDDLTPESNFKLFFKQDNRLTRPHKEEALNEQRLPNSTNLHTHGLHISSIVSPLDNAAKYVKMLGEFFSKEMFITIFLVILFHACWCFSLLLILNEQSVAIIFILMCRVYIFSAIAPLITHAIFINYFIPLYDTVKSKFMLYLPFWLNDCLTYTIR